jgi:hypothetical protein
MWGHQGRGLGNPHLVRRTRKCYEGSTWLTHVRPKGAGLSSAAGGQGRPPLGQGTVPARPRRRPGQGFIFLRVFSASRRSFFSRSSTFNRTFTLLNDGIPTGSGSFSAFCAHSAFSLGAHSKADPTDDHPDTGCRAFLNDPASLRSGFLNDVVVRKGWCNDESCQGSTSKNCSHELSFHVISPETRTPLGV